MVNFLLQETNDFLLQETNDKIILDEVAGVSAQTVFMSPNTGFWGPL